MNPWTVKLLNLIGEIGRTMGMFLFINSKLIRFTFIGKIPGMAGFPRNKKISFFWHFRPHFSALQTTFFCTSDHIFGTSDHIFQHFRPHFSVLQTTFFCTSDHIFLHFRPHFRHFRPHFLHFRPHFSALQTTFFRNRRIAL